MSANSAKASITLTRLACPDCSQARGCLPRELSPLAVSELEQVIGHTLIFHRGEYLYQTGDPFESIFIVRSGAIKTFCADESGRESILGLYLPTEIIGIDAIDKGVHPYSAVALETSSCCPISSDRITHSARGSAEVYRQIMKAIGKEFIEEEERMLMILSKRSSIERVAAFLLNLSARFRRIGYSWQEFRLPLTRSEMGGYLGLTMETTSRIMQKLQTDKLIKSNGRMVTILDPAGLTRIAGTGRCSLLAC